MKKKRKQCFECKHEISRVCTFDKLKGNHKSIADIFETPIWCPLIIDSIHITQFYSGMVSKRAKVHFCGEDETYCKTLRGGIPKIKQEIGLINYCKNCLTKLEYSYDYKREAIWIYNGKFYEGWAGLRKIRDNNEWEPEEEDENIKLDLFPLRIVTMGLIEKFKKNSDDYTNLREFVKKRMDVKIKSYKIWLEKEACRVWSQNVV